MCYCVHSTNEMKLYCIRIYPYYCNKSLLTNTVAIDKYNLISPSTSACMCHTTKLNNKITVC